MDVYDRPRRRRLVIVRFLLVDPGKVSIPVLIDLKGGEEFGVVVLAGEAEARSVVTAKDLAVIAAAGGLDRLHHPTGPVIVGGYRQRPIAEQIMVMREQLRGGLRGPNRVEAII